MQVKPIGLAVLLLVMAPVMAEPTYRLFATNERDNTLSVINSKTLEVEQTIDIGQRPRGIGFSEDGKLLYVVASNDNQIVAIDPKTLEIVKKIDTGEEPETFAVNPVNGFLVTSSEYDGEATFIDPSVN